MVTLSLDDSELPIIEHVQRYRLTVPKAVAGLSLLGTKAVPDACEALERLVSHGWLRTDMLSSGSSESYYYLTPKAHALIGGGASAPLKRDQRFECYARLIFCCTGSQFRQLFTRHEFAEKFANLWFPGQPVSYYLERQEGRAVRLAYLKLDRDGHGRWERLIDSCSAFLQQRTNPRAENPRFAKQTSEFRKLADQGKFQFTVLTAMPEKKLAIEMELERRSLSGREVPPIEVHVIPELFELLYPPVLDRS